MLADSSGNSVAVELVATGKRASREHMEKIMIDLNLTAFVCLYHKIFIFIFFGKRSDSLECVLLQIGPAGYSLGLDYFVYLQQQTNY